MVMLYKENGHSSSGTDGALGKIPALTMNFYCKDEGEWENGTMDMRWREEISNQQEVVRLIPNASSYTGCRKNPGPVVCIFNACTQEEDDGKRKV